MAVTSRAGGVTRVSDKSDKRRSWVCLPHHSTRNKTRGQGILEERKVTVLPFFFVL